MTLRKYIGRATPVAMIFFSGALPTLHAQTGGGYVIKKSTIDGGGVTFHSDGSYRLGGTVGQHDARVVTGGEKYRLTGGFWSPTGGIATGDFDGDGDTDLDDFVMLFDCIQGPGGGLQQGCDAQDLDDDGGVDLRDVSRFQSLFTGPLE